MQHRLLFIKQNPINIRVIHVPRTKLNCRQAFAAAEGHLPDTGDSIWNCDARQAAVTEGPKADVGDAIWYSDGFHTFAPLEGTLADADDAGGDRDARQAGTTLEGS